jgi:NAD(P)-dependent dehydrogenase (short-subunit alcohol dehydrogenase family)
MEQLKLDGKVAIVTGSTSGIGKGIAQCFGKAGANVVVVGRREDKGNATVKEIVKMGRDAIFVKADLLIENDIKNVVEQANGKFKKIDILVNNAGVAGGGPLHEMSLDDWERIVNTNARAYFLMSKYVLPHMIEQKNGNIIHISSASAHRSIKGGSLYCFSKAGLSLLAKEMAKEYAPFGIRVNELAPGFTKSELTYDADGEILPEVKMLLDETPLGFGAEPEDIGHAAVYLASDDARFVTGAALVVDGGWSCF